MVHKLFLTQLTRATGPDGVVDLERLGAFVSTTYDEADRDQRRTERVAAEMAEEVEKHNRHLYERETELKTQNTRFEAALDNMSQGLCMTDAEHRIVVCNRQFAELLELPPELATPGVSILRVFRHCVDTGVFEEPSAQAIIERFVANVEGRTPVVLQRRIRSGRTLQVSGRPMPDGGWVGTYHDITEQQRAREEAERHSLAQRQQSQLLKDALDNMKIGVALYDADLRLDVFNPRYLEIYGLAPGELTQGMAIGEARRVRQTRGHQIFSEDGRPLQDIFAGGGQQSSHAKGEEETIVVLNKRIIRVTRYARAGGGWVVMFDDITERREAEVALAVQNAQFRDALANMGQGVAMYDQNDNLVVHNQHFLEINKLTPEDVKPGTKLRDIVVRFLESGLSSETVEERMRKYHPLGRTRRSFSDLRADEDGRVYQLDRYPRPEGGWVVVHRDVTERERARKELEHSESAQRRQSQLLNDALDHMGYGLNVFDGDGFVLIYNKQYLEITGLAEADVAPGSTMRQIINRCREVGTFPESADEFYDQHQDAFSNKRFFEHRQTSAHGRVVNSSFYPRAGGGWVVLHRDITEQIKAEAEKQAVAAEAELSRQHEQAALAASEAKSAFLAVMSHEIRTPMNAIIGLSSALLDSGLQGEQLHLATTIHDSSNGLLRLLNDILDVSKLDAARVEFEAAPFSFAATIDHALSIINASAVEKGLVLRADIDPQMPAAVIGDEARVRQVILNLASNAIKFTEAGSVEVSARCLGSADGKATIECAVRDTGIGIAADKLAHLFNEFSQADASIHRRFGGTGLGLAISRRIVTQMGGDIRVDSTPGQGSTFTFTLTLPWADPAALAEPASVTSYEDFAYMLASLDEPLAILLAEDNATNQLVFTKLMQDLNVKITIAANGREALQLAQAIVFDVVFMDMRMPEMDGIEATRAIRALGGEWARVPIVALTANAFADDAKACRDAGMDEFLSKPVRKQTLVETLAKLLVGYPGPTAADDQPVVHAIDHLPMTPPAEVAMTDVAAICDESAIDRLIEEIDYDGARMTLDVFLADSTERLALLRRLSTETDRKRIRDEAHTLKGASATFGLRQVSELAKSLEQFAPAIAAPEYADLLDRLDACFVTACNEVEAVMAMRTPAE